MLLVGRSAKESRYVTLCREWTLVKNLGDVRYSKPLPCRAWSCGECGPCRRRQLIQQASAGEPNRLLTLTTSLEVGADSEERYQILMHAWQLVWKRMKRLPRFEGAAYLWVVEATERGEPHLHILLRCDFVSQSWLSECMAELAQSPIVDIRKVRGARQAAAYVAKYVAKSPARFGNSKRYFASRNYELDKLEKLADDLSRLGSWTLVKDTPYHVYQDFISDGFAGRIERGEMLVWFDVKGLSP